MSAAAGDAVRGQVAVVGVGATAQGEFPDKSADDLAVDAVALALDDAGLDKGDLDGLITCRSNDGGIDTTIGAMLGVNPRYSATLDYGSCSFSTHLAVMAVASGMAGTVAVAYGTNQRSTRRRFAEATSGGDFSAPYGYLHIGGPAAMAFTRHQHCYGTTEAQLGAVSVGQREWAARNPAAIFRSPMTLDDYLASPYLVRPLRRPDFTLISDGGAAAIFTDRDLASTRQPPVHVLGMEETTSLRDLQNPDQMLRPHLRHLAERLYRAAGVTAADVDALYIQDPTSVWVLQMLEWFGFCPVGEGGPFLEEGHTRFGGDLPLNTSGGQLSEAYMWGFLHLVELVRQLRGTCGDRQVPGANVAMLCSTMAFLKGAATVFAREIP